MKNVQNDGFLQLLLENQTGEGAILFQNVNSGMEFSTKQRKNGKKGAEKDKVRRLTDLLKRSMIEKTNVDWCFYQRFR